jgi:hypothetical protein
MNKYQKHSKAKLTKNLERNLKNTQRDPIDDFDEAHKESLEKRDQRITSAFKVARQMFEILSESDLNEEGRLAAMQFLAVLRNRYDSK